MRDGVRAVRARLARLVEVAAADHVLAHQGDRLEVAVGLHRPAADAAGVGEGRQVASEPGAGQVERPRRRGQAPHRVPGVGVPRPRRPGADGQRREVALAGAVDLRERAADEDRARPGGHGQRPHAGVRARPPRRVERAGRGRHARQAPPRPAAPPREVAAGVEPPARDREREDRSVAAGGERRDGSARLVTAARRWWPVAPTMVKSPPKKTLPPGPSASARTAALGFGLNAVRCPDASIAAMRVRANVPPEWFMTWVNVPAR